MTGRKIASAPEMTSKWVERALPGTALLCTLSTVAWGQAAGAANAAERSNRDVKAETVMKISAPLTVAAVGDIIEPQPLYSSDPGFQKLIDNIRKADVGFGNMESTLVDFRHFQGAVAGTEAPLEMGEAIKAMGITIMNHANNHTFDGGVNGMISTDEMLDKLGIVHSGTGRDLQEARAAHFQETPKGRVGLVGMFSVIPATTARITRKPRLPIATAI